MPIKPQPGLEPTEADPVLNAYLHDLLDVGAAIAQDLKRQAQARAEPPAPAEPPHPTTDLAEPFERVARAMRRTILLIRHIAKPAHHRTAARKRIIRAVEDAIQSEADPNEAEPLRTEFRERLDAPDLEEEIDTRPVAEIITDIIRDLGLAHFPGIHPWARRTPRDLEALNTRAAHKPPGPYDPAPHGPDLHESQPGAPPRPPSKPPDRRQDLRDMIQLAQQLTGG